MKWVITNLNSKWKFIKWDYSTQINNQCLQLMHFNKSKILAQSLKIQFEIFHQPWWTRYVCSLNLSSKQKLKWKHQMKIFTYNRFRALLFNRYTLRKTTQKGNFEREILKYPMGPYKDEIATPTFEDVYGSEMKFSIGLVSI